MYIPNFKLLFPFEIYSWKQFFSIQWKFNKHRYRYFYQQIIRGWSDDETWSLFVPLSEYILPRLIRFREIRKGNPCDITDEKWDTIIGKMIFAFEDILNEPRTSL